MDLPPADDPYSSAQALGLLTDGGLSAVLPNATFFPIAGALLLLLLYLSALVSGAEVAYFSLKPDQIARTRTLGASYQRIAELLKNPRRLLATILIFNNFVNISIVTLSTLVAWRLTGGVETEGRVVVVFTTIVTITLLLFGEILPKVFANQNNLEFAHRTSRLLALAYSVLLPISALLNGLSTIIEKRMKHRGYDVSVEDLNQALELTATEETTEEEKGILKGIVNFGTLQVKQIMRSRMDITAFDMEMDYHQLMDQINKVGYSRVPVYEDTVDSIKGVLYVKDLLPHINQDETFAWTELLREGYFVPETMKIESLLREFQANRVHMAIVVDEYGGTAGLITMEDIIEEIVGEINDEFDDEDHVAFNKLDEDTFIFEGKTSLHDFCKVAGVEASMFDEVKGESESLGGLLLEINTKLPRSGDKINFGAFLFTVVAVDPRRIKKVRVFIDRSALSSSAKA